MQGDVIMDENMKKNPPGFDTKLFLSHLKHLSKWEINLLEESGTINNSEESNLRESNRSVAETKWDREAKNKWSTENQLLTEPERERKREGWQLSEKDLSDLLQILALVRWMLPCID